ncbi:MAG: two component transcriptional regulator, AraC family [Anaerocolumna sp.]|jgi:two-component system response regulator YesN|nr:two component transcriptional regulator, AraC family [Anaerocolumna sp.]
MENEMNTLLNVLLVDDEPFIRKGLTALIDWEAEGFTVAGEAQNGYQAVDMLKEKNFQLVISDIKMPDMNGIELAEYIKKNQISEGKFIFLSGFYDFTYAKSAILCGCLDYVLKPIKKEELLTILRRIHGEIQKEIGGEKNKRICEKAYLDRNLMALIWGKYDEINLSCVKEKLNLMGEVMYVHMELNLLDENFYALSEEKRREHQRKLYAYAGLVMKKYADHIIFGATKKGECYDIGIIYCPFMAKEKGVTDEEWLNWFTMELKERAGYDIAACAGSKVKGIEDIAFSYREATMTRSFRFFKKHEKKNYQPYLTNKKNSNSKSAQEEYYRKELDCLIHAIETGDRVFIKENSGDLYCRMLERSTDPELITLNIQYFLYRLLGLAYEIEGGINQEEIMKYIQEVAFSSGMPWINELKFLKFALDYSDYLVQLRQESAKGTINKIEAEIEAYYAENLSLKSLGEKYFINSAYLGQLFKKQYGCSFKDYVNGVRIRKAAELLLRTDEKVYIIAELVGYKNLEYFINKFENIYGITPARFRKRNCGSISNC